MHGPKEKKERSLGERLQLKGTRCASPKCAMVRKPYRPGMHGPKSRPKTPSEFGRQLKEKQKFKVSYGIDERALRHVFRVASARRGSVAAHLMELLERRLDNVVYRLGFAPSRAMARQMVSHGHIFVNDNRVKSPGYEVRTGDMIRIRPASATKGQFRELKEAVKKYDPPSWLALDPEKIEGRVLALPEDVTPPFEVNLLVESFSK